VSTEVEPARTGRDEVVLEVVRDPALVRTVRLVAAAFARRNRLTEDVVEEVRLAVGEACAVLIGTEEESAVSDGVLRIRLAHDEGLHVEVSGTAGPQQQVLSDLGLDPWAVMRGLVEDGAVTGGVDESEDGATVRLSWAA
jgi:anti-sigma regulatory factor (Ser/Thr protein kinase)